MVTVVRPETKENDCAITQITDAAFNRARGGRLVEILRRHKAFIEQLSLVVLYDRKLVGEILFSPIEIENQCGKWKSLALAPMDVLPNRQRQRIGSEFNQVWTARVLFYNPYSERRKVYAECQRRSNQLPV